MTTNKKNHNNIKELTAKNVVGDKTDEPTMTDALKSALNSRDYFSRLTKIIIKKRLTISELVELVDKNKDSLAYRHSLSYRSYGQSPISTIKIYNRFVGGFKHYSHLIKTDVKHKINLINSNGEIIKNTADINDKTRVIDFKTA